jgi:hypothetical protein
MEGYSGCLIGLTGAVRASWAFGLRHFQLSLYTIIYKMHNVFLDLTS